MMKWHAMYYFEKLAASFKGASAEKCMFYYGCAHEEGQGAFIIAPKASSTPCTTAHLPENQPQPEAFAVVVASFSSVAAVSTSP